MTGSMIGSRLTRIFQDPLSERAKLNEWTPLVGIVTQEVNLSSLLEEEKDTLAFVCPELLCRANKTSARWASQTSSVSCRVTP
jgi:hypothetical protein